VFTSFSKASERLSGNIKLTLHKASIKSIMTCLSSLGGGRHLSTEPAAPAKHNSPHKWQLS